MRLTLSNKNSWAVKISKCACDFCIGEIILNVKMVLTENPFFVGDKMSREP